MLRLPWEVKDLFREWLAEHFPERAAHVMSLVRAMRGGRDNDPQFGTRMHATGPVAAAHAPALPAGLPQAGLSSRTRAASLPTHLFQPATYVHILNCLWTVAVSWEPVWGLEVTK